MLFFHLLCENGHDIFHQLSVLHYLTGLMDTLLVVQNSHLSSCWIASLNFPTTQLLVPSFGILPGAGASRKVCPNCFSTTIAQKWFFLSAWRLKFID